MIDDDEKEFRPPSFREMEQMLATLPYISERQFEQFTNDLRQIVVACRIDAEAAKWNSFAAVALLFLGGMLSLIRWLL